MPSLNLQNRTITVAYANGVPYSTWNNTHPVGLESRILFTLAKHFNFVVRLVYAEPFGMPLSNGSWSGLIGKVATEEADLGIGGITMTPDRLKVINYLDHYWFFNPITFGTSPPRERFNRFALFLTPFRWQIWLSLFVCFFLFWLFNGSHLFDDYRRPRNDSGNRNFLWITIQLMFRQNSSRLNHLPASRKILAIIWLLAIIVLTNAYQGYLCSMLTVPYRPTIDTIQELVEASQQNQVIVLTQGRSIQGYFNKTERFKPVFENSRNLDGQYSAIHTIMNGSYSERFVFIATERLLKMERFLHGTDSLYLTPRLEEAILVSRLAGIVVRKTFPFQRQLSHALAHIRSAGLLDRWLQTEQPRADHVAKLEHHCPLLMDADGQTNQQPDQLDRLASVFYLYLFGILVAILVLAIEFFPKIITFGQQRWHRRRSSIFLILLKPPPPPSPPMQ